MLLRLLSGRQWCATAMQAPREPKQHFAPTCSAPAWIAVLGVGALGDDAVAVALAHQPAHAGRLADPGYEAHANHCASARVAHDGRQHRARPVRS